MHGWQEPQLHPIRSIRNEAQPALPPLQNWKGCHHRTSARVHPIKPRLEWRHPPFSGHLATPVCRDHGSLEPHLSLAVISCPLLSLLRRSTHPAGLSLSPNSKTITKQWIHLRSRNCDSTQAAVTTTPATGVHKGWARNPKSKLYWSPIGITSKTCI